MMNFTMNDFIRNQLPGALLAALLILSSSLAGAAEPADLAAQPGDHKKSVVLTELPNAPLMDEDYLGAPTAVGDEVEIINLFVGEATTLPIGGVTRVAVGNGKLITATAIDGQEVLLLGEAPGDTSLFIWSHGRVLKYRIKVNTTDIQDLSMNVQAMIHDIPNVKLDRIGDQVVLSGTASKAELKKLETIAGGNKQIVNLVREEEVTMKKMVYVKVQIMEFRRNALENIGIDWATQINGPAAAVTADVIANQQFRYTPSSADPTFTVGQGANQALRIRSQPWRMYLGLATSITSRINLAVNNGDAGILAAPELATRSGGEAKFLAGGQVPLITSSNLGSPSVSYKDFGIRLNVTPVVDENNLIQAKLETEISAIDPSTSISAGGTSVPGFSTRSTSSDINLKSGQTIVLSGLVNQDLSNAVTKFPWLGDVPILGNFFKSKEFRAGRTDLVMFVTPTVVDPASTSNQQRLEKGKQMREKFEGMLGKQGIVD